MSNQKASILIGLLWIIAGCSFEIQHDEGGCYRDSVYEVTCSDQLYVDTLYQMHHSVASIYTVRYENKQGQRVRIPNDCVMVELRTNLPVPDSLKQKTRGQNE